MTPSSDIPPTAGNRAAVDRVAATMASPLARESGTFSIGGDLPVVRLGYGAMQLTGPGVWGLPRDPDEAIRVLRRAVEVGVTLFDTADSYGPGISEELIGEALSPYGDDIVVATKAGFTRPGPGQWVPVGRPAYLKQQVELSLRRLRRESIDLIQLHRIDPEVPLADQLGAFVELQQQGKVRHIGLSQISIDELRAAQQITSIATVQNLYNLTDRSSEALLEVCTAEGIGFIPWFPLATGGLATSGGPLDELAHQHDASPAQLALAWLLKKSPVMLPIPGTSSVAHLDQNVGAAAITLTDAEEAELDAIG